MQQKGETVGLEPELMFWLDCAYFLGFVRLASLSFPLQAYAHLDKPDVLASCTLGKSQKSNASINKWQQNVVYS